MFNLTHDVESDIDAIDYYYKQQERLDFLFSYMTQLYGKIAKIHEETSKIQRQLEIEKNGLYKDVIDFVFENGKYITKQVNKKLRNGSLENLKQFISEDNENKAINAYLKSKGIKIRCNEAVDIDKLLGLEEEE